MMIVLALGASCAPVCPAALSPSSHNSTTTLASATTPTSATASATASASASGSASASAPATAAPTTTTSAPPPAPVDTLRLGLTFDLPAPTLTGQAPLALWATYYYIPRVTPIQTGHPLRDMQGQPLGPRLSLRDWCEAAMQGTVSVVSPPGPDRVFNYAGVTRTREVDCKPIYPKHPAISRTRFTRAVGPYGDGVRRMILLPFRSIAVDRRLIPYGSVIYIPAARGIALTLPDGRQAQHDGYFFAADRGGAIKGNHIDVFIGSATRNPFAFVRSRRRPTFDAYVVAQHAARQRLSAAHQPPRQQHASP